MMTMSDTTVEKESIRIKAKDNSDGSFLFSTHNLAGGAGVADSSIEIQGYRILAHDNGDSTFSLTTTTSTGAGDVNVEWEGLRFKLHPTGINVTIAGLAIPTYAVVVNPI